MSFLRVFNHLLPDARAWRIGTNKRLRQFFEGLAASPAEDTRQFFDSIWLELLPESTTSLDEWEDQFGLQSSGLTEQERRARLAAVWRATGGQSPRYVQDTLQGAGFDVYVHEWWAPVDTPAPGEKVCVTPRNPLQYLRRETDPDPLLVECGEPDVQCGEIFAQAGNTLGPRGYPLVNKILRTAPDFIPLCGEPVAECGEPEALCGNFDKFIDEQVPYVLPTDPDKWPFFLYIGGEEFGTLAQVDPSRKNEFERLCLKICPAQQWLGVLVEYV